MTEPQEGSTWKYECIGCQTDNDGNPENKIVGNLNTRGTAETLAKIHAIKTGHDPKVYRE